MKCYLCYLQTGQAANDALGICSTCGAGICHEHIVVVGKRAVSGMAGSFPASQQLRCSRCWELAHSTSPPQQLESQREEPSRRRFSLWEKWRGKASPPALPTPKDAVAAVEHFLKSQTPEEK